MLTIHLPINETKKIVVKTIFVSVQSVLHKRLQFFLHTLSSAFAYGLSMMVEKTKNINNNNNGYIPGKSQHITVLHENPAEFSQET